MYCSTNFKTKKELKQAVADGKRVTVYSPGIGAPPVTGSCAVEGPHYPQPHKWYASVELKDGVIVKVK